MEIKTSSEFQTIYPSYVLHKHFEMPAGFNDVLFALAKEDAERNKITENGHGRNVGDTSNHLGHLRHNFLMDTKHPAIDVFVQMVDASIREYLRLAYGYDHTGDISMMSDTFLQERSKRQNIGINTHTHIQTDIVCTYYPRVTLDPDCLDTSLHKGALRFYDPANVGKRLWPCRNPEGNYTGGWYSLEPRTGSMVVFEGYVPHDSTYFEGDERMCIPVLCDLELPNSHCKVRASEVLAFQRKEN
jgi:hypothetical protein